MAEYTYQTRKKITENWINGLKEKGAKLSPLEKKMLPNSAYFRISYETREEIENMLTDKNGRIITLSELYRKKFSDLVNICIPENLEDEFYYALDQMNEYQMTAGWYRRSLRSKSYVPFVSRSVSLLMAYSKLKFYGQDFSDILTGQVSPEIYDHARVEEWNYDAILAAGIDNGNEKTIQAVKDILLGEGNTAMISHEMIRGIVMSKSEELYELLGKFLLAARLQEGARQAVCESMDAGRKEAFLYLFKVIEDNNLVRYSSVKRAVSTWIGIFNEKSVDRITDKLIKLMGQCLRDEKLINEQLASNDSVAISCALWAKGFYDAEDAVLAVMELIKKGTKNQKMTASYFNNTLQREELKMKAAKEVILKHSDEMELAACFMQAFMASTSSIFFELVKSNNESYYSVRDGKVTEPKRLEVERFFESRKEAEEVYGILKDIFERVPKKGVVLEPCIFPWHSVTMSRSDIAIRLCLIAWMLQDEDKLDESAEMIPLIGQGNSYNTLRAAVARVLLYRPKSEKRKAILFELIHNAEEYTSKAAYLLVDDIADNTGLSQEDFMQIEQNLKYKKGRMETLSLLRKQKPEQLRECISRLLESKTEESHMGALDLSLEIKKQNAKEFEYIEPFLRKLDNPTEKEQILLEELIGTENTAQNITNMPGYGLYNPDKEWVLPPVTEDGKDAVKLFSHGEKECIRVYEKLDSLIEANKEKEYTTAWNVETLLGTTLEVCRWTYKDPDAKPLDSFPFPELWQEFYEKEIKTPEFVMELYFYQKCYDERNFYEYNIALYRDVFGSGIIKKAPFKDLARGYRYAGHIKQIINALFRQYVPAELEAKCGLAVTAKLLKVLNNSNDLFNVKDNRYASEETYTKRATELPVFSDAVSWLGAAKDDNWGSAFSMRFKLGEYYDTQKHREKEQKYGWRSEKKYYLELSDYVNCHEKGIWDKDLFYKAVFTYLDLGKLLRPISTISQEGAISMRDARTVDISSFFGYDVIEPVDGKYHFDKMGSEIPSMEFARNLYNELIPMVLSVELKRGEQPTIFSEHIKSIKVVYGIDYMIQILKALGKDTLQRGYSYYSSSVDRKKVLSHLLKVCRPKKNETAQDLKKALKGTNITKKRLVELAMYAQQWIPMVEEYLELEGFQSGCYYFIAHTSENLDEFDTSMIAKYTPLSPEELRDGAFDIKWFFEAYGKLGDKNWQLLYDAAKYSSTGAAHARARKYADAALGKTDKKELMAEIDAKRNKDLLMSMGLLPLSDETNEREAELLDRYTFIQKYKKESRQFGAQRRASEGRAVEIALRNLSVNAGYTDVTRLTLRMENKLAESLYSCFEWIPLEDIELKISVDETGKSSLSVRKDGKELKSVPSKYKKSELVLEYQDINKKLKEQYSRTKQMMELAMEDGTEFEVWELLELSKNPVVKPIVSPLIVCAKSCMGFLNDKGIEDQSGNITKLEPDDRVKIAHPYDLYKGGHWHEYQKLLFERQIKQPFKQVFRELYVKLSEELDKEHSLMFSGNQIQPQKTVGTLRSRRWVADYEDGLQKIYYKEDIVARIYAMADWFSPSDIEAPTLDWVVFMNRKTFKTLKISEVPDIIYSEVMRDVDLAVSVAHAGGVDPETSHSTIEMRRVIVECNLELFGIKNVRIDKNHAVIDGKLGQYTVHLGSGVVHQMGNSMIFAVPVHSQHRGRLFLPFVDDDPKTAEIMSKILMFAEDTKIKDPSILSQIK